MKRGIRWRLAGIVLLVACGLLYVFREPILFALGDVLVYHEKPVPGDAVLVLGGDTTGYRIVKGAQLVQDGLAPLLVVSGGGEQYGFPETELAMNFIAKKGFPREKMIPVPYLALSTTDEAVHAIPLMRSLGVKRYILVSSYSHTARARQVFRRAAPDLPFTVVGCYERYWDNGRWWTNREGRKIWFYAFTKTIADYLGI